MHTNLTDPPFLAEMLDDDYYPPQLVLVGVRILEELCQQIEADNPTTDDEILALTHAATERFNELNEAFWEQDSDIETVARECIAEDFGRIVDAYGFNHLDIEDVIAPRDW